MYSMQKIWSCLSVFLGLLVVFFSCTNKEINLITNINYEIALVYEEAGFVTDTLATTIKLLPERVDYEGFNYFLKYEITEGEGYFVSENHEIIKAGEEQQLRLEDEYIANWRYIGTTPGTHRITMYSRDNFDRSKEDVLVYNIQPLEVIWDTSTTQTIIKVADEVPILLDLQNQTDVSIPFTQSITLLAGTGKLLDQDKNEILYNQSFPVVEGQTPFFFIPDAVGSVSIQFDLIFNERIQYTSILMIEVIKESTNLAPIAIATIKDNGTNKGVAPFTVDLEGTASVDNDGTIENYSWDFGDESPTMFGATVNHVFTAIGQYVVTLTVTDDKGVSHSDSLTVFVEKSMDDDFVAMDDAVTIDVNTAIDIDVQANDQIGVGISSVLDTVTQPLNGTATIGNDGVVSYMPAAGFEGVDKFSYTIIDGLGKSSSAEVIVTVQLTNALPIAVNDNGTTKENIQITLAVLENDSDPEGKPINVIATTAPDHGTINVNINGSITYTPTTGYFGSDMFEYTINDGKEGNDATATVTITITDVNEPPVVTDFEKNTTDIAILLIDILENVVDAEDSLSVTSVEALNGTVVNNEDGTITYTPIEGVDAIDQITFTVSDGTNDPVSGVIKINVTAVQMVEIPKGMFEAYVIDQGLDTRGIRDGKMIKEDAEKVATLLLDEIGDINSLDFMSVFQNLNTLEIINTTTTDLDLARLSKIEKLSISNTAIGFNLGAASQLKEFSCKSCRITSLNMSRSTDLEVFFVTFDQSVTQNLGNLNLSNSPKLQDFYLGESASFSRIQLASPVLKTATFNNCSGITDLDFSACTGLQSLLINEGMQELTSINVNNGANAVLDTFDCSGVINTSLLCVQVDDMAAAALNTKWKIPGQDAKINKKAHYSNDCNQPRETIAIPDENFEDLLGVEGYDEVMDGKIFKDVAQAVKRLNLSSYGIDSFQGLEEFVSVEELSIDEANIREVLNFSKMKNLTELSLNDTNIRSLSVVNNLKLKDLSFNNSSIEMVDLSNNRELVSIEAKLSSLKTLDLSNNPNIVFIDIKETDVESLDLSNNNKLTFVDAREGSLTQITLPLQGVLKSLYLRDSSRVEELSVKGQDSLEVLSVEGSGLSCIEVDDVADATARFGVKPRITYSVDCL